MTSREKYVFLIFTAVYFVLHYIQHHGIGFELLRFYGKDLLLVPFLMLGIKTTAYILGIKINIGLKELIATVLTCILSFEVIFPRLGMAFAPDLIDVFCYVIGGIFYFILFLQKPDKKKSTYIFETQ